MKKTALLLSLLVFVGCAGPAGEGGDTIAPPVNSPVERKVWLGTEPKTEKYPNGQTKVARIPFSDDQTGVWKYWDEQGNLTRSEDYKNGKLTDAAYYKNGKLTHIYRNGHLTYVADKIGELTHGESNSSDRRWKVKKVDLEELPEAVRKKIIRDRAQYEGAREGREPRQTNGGSAEGADPAVGGRKRVFSHANGNKQAEGTFVSGKKEGVWASWHENGQKESEGTYKAGEKEGVWTYWDEQGNVTKTETYKNGELVK